MQSKDAADKYDEFSCLRITDHSVRMKICYGSVDMRHSRKRSGINSGTAFKGL